MLISETNGRISEPRAELYALAALVTIAIVVPLACNFERSTLSLVLYGVVKLRVDAKTIAFCHLRHADGRRLSKIAHLGRPYSHQPSTESRCG
jgi:hypothetical protein